MKPRTKLYLAFLRAFRHYYCPHDRVLFFNILQNKFIRFQFNMLTAGIRDVRISDSACVCWCNAGQLL